MSGGEKKVQWIIFGQVNARARAMKVLGVLGDLGVSLQVGLSGTAAGLKHDPYSDSLAAPHQSGGSA